MFEINTNTETATETMTTPTSTASTAPTENPNWTVPGASPMLDVFSKDLSSIALVPPILNKGLQPCTIVACEARAAKDKVNFNLYVQVQTKYQAIGTKGEQIPPGFKLERYFSLKPNNGKGEDRTESVLRDLKAIRAAVGLNPDERFGDPVGYLNRDVTISGDIETDEDGKYAPKNTIARFVAK